MFYFEFAKVILCAALLTSGCHFWQSKPVDEPPPLPSAVEDLKSEVPFATKEPEIYQTEIVVTANNIENTIFTARNGANHLTAYDYGKNSEFALLRNDAGKSFLIARNRQVYAENQAVNFTETDDFFPTAELLNEEHAATFEMLGAENNAAKYLVRFADSPNAEIVITIDEKINLPVKQEFYSVASDRRSLVSTTEMKNFRLQTDAQIFVVPEDYKKVSAAEFQEILRRERAK